jgi:membrane-bound lytic murein transglycosylase D
MLRIPVLLVASVAVLLASPAVAAEELLPRPAGLEPNVRFWTRIYSEIDASGGFVHDSQHLDVVYEVVRFPEGLSRRSRERKVEKIKKNTVTILRQLARGKRTDLSEEQARVLGRWPAGVSDSTLRTAARHVRFQLGQADRFRAGLARAGAWHDYIEQALDANGVPRELAALPHVESSYNPKAYSRVGAAGLWQFTRSTGRLFLRVDHVVDERLDARKASVAAAKLLRSNYERLGTWPLAITAYNHGVSGMARAVRKLGTEDIATISKHYDGYTFGFASRNFYSEFLAALDVDRDAERYFGPIHTERPQQFDTVVVDHFYTPETLERAFGVDRETLREYNRSLRPSVWNGTKYVPRGYELTLPPNTLSQPAAEMLASIPAGERKTEQHRDRYYKVRRGDTLSKIAQRYRIRERELVVSNNLRSRHRIRVGQVLVLPDHASGGRTTVARSAPPADGIYRVRRGDALWMIAQRFGVNESALAAENGLRDRNRIAVGQRLRIPGAQPVVVASAASAPAAAEKLSIPATPEPAKTPAAAADAVNAAPASTNGSKTASARAVPASYPANVPVPDPSDYAVHGDDRITVQAAETLGHYAEWLEVPTSRLRRLNGMNYGTPVAIGRKTKLDFSRVTPETFEERRLQYHHALQEEYFAAFEVIGTLTHVLRPGDSLWYLAEREYEVPVWLIRQFNPDLDFGAFHAGTRMLIPEVGRRES